MCSAGVDWAGWFVWALVNVLGIVIVGDFGGGADGDVLGRL